MPDLPNSPAWTPSGGLPPVLAACSLRARWDRQSQAFPDAESREGESRKVNGAKEAPSNTGGCRFGSSVFSVIAATFAQLIEGRFETSGEFVRRASTPIVEEDYDGSRIGHMMVDCHDFKSVPTQRFEGCCNLSFQHRHIAGYRRIFIGSDERSPGVEPHAGIDGSSHLFHVEVIAPQGDLVNRAVLLALVPHDFRNARGVQSAFCRGACGGVTRRWGGRSMSNKVQSGLDLIRQVHGLTVTVNVHEEHLWLCPEEMIVQGSDFQPMLKQRRHDWIDFCLQEHQISHHHVITAVTFGHGKPSTESERRRHGIVRDRHMQIVAWDVDLEHVCFVVTRLTHKFENLLVVAGYVLGMCH